MGDIQINPIIVNDGSNNEFIAEIENVKEKLESLTYLNYKENKGKGYAIKHGIKNSSAEYILFTDVDFPYELESMKLLLQKLRSSDVDLVIGTRNKDYETKIPFQRKIISSILKALIKLFIRIPVADTQAGLKGVSSKAKPIILEVDINRYLFDLALLKLASKRGLKITPIPVVLREGIHLPTVSVGVLIKESINFFKILIKY